MSKLATNVFHLGGALPADSSVYIERQSDKNALTHLMQMHYITLIEPRQQGKTSLIFHLPKRLKEYSFCYIDLTTLDATSEAAWYETICARLFDKLHWVTEADQPKVPANGMQWYSFLYAVAKLAMAANRRVVIELDEIGAAELSWAEHFFANIRAAHNARGDESAFNFVTFILAGAYDPRNLIKDKKISPFNVAQSVWIQDFDLQQVIELVRFLGLDTQREQIVAERVHHWTDGHPYLTQSICHELSALGQSLSADDVDARVETLLYEDNKNLPQIVDALMEDQGLRDYTIKLLGGFKPLFDPLGNRRHAGLKLAGVIKADETRRCKIRNRIYERILKGAFLDSSGDAQGDSGGKPVVRGDATGNGDRAAVGADVQTQVILLVHGIRTRAYWQPMVVRNLQQGDKIIVRPVGYGYLDVFRFWFPFFTRQFSVKKVENEIRQAKRLHQNAKLSIIAHSFGTYAVADVLLRHNDIELDRLVMCGAIVSPNYNWDRVRDQVKNGIVNECGRRDVWPVLARSMTWGYGSTGTWGIGRVTVTDRIHNLSHSAYFTEDFVNDYWKTLMVDGVYKPPQEAEEDARSPWWFSLLGVPWKYVGLLAFLLILARLLAII